MYFPFSHISVHWRSFAVNQIFVAQTMSFENAFFRLIWVWHRRVNWQIYYICKDIWWIVTGDWWMVEIRKKELGCGFKTRKKSLCLCVFVVKKFRYKGSLTTLDGYENWKCLCWSGLQRLGQYAGFAETGIPGGFGKTAIPGLLENIMYNGTPKSRRCKERE